MDSTEHTINVNVIHTINDDVWSAMSDDIFGFFLQSDGFANFLADLTENGAEMLRLNRGFNEEQLSRTVFLCHVKHEVEQSSANSKSLPESKIMELQLAVA